LRQAPAKTLRARAWNWCRGHLPLFVIDAIRWTRLGNLGQSRARPARLDEPFLTPSDTLVFREALASARVYLEYGAGGSTVWAARQVSTIVVVDSHKPTLDAAVERARREGCARIVPIHGDIGPVVGWGAPLFRRRSRRRVNQWSRYVARPWDLLEKEGLVPDLIFIDGRFRVACVLEALLRLPPGADCRILFDDFDREEKYRAVLEFTTCVARYDRLAVLRRAEHLDRERCRAVREAYYADFR
jgi:hypothetical protein